MVNYMAQMQMVLRTVVYSHYNNISGEFSCDEFTYHVLYDQ